MALGSSLTTLVFRTAVSAWRNGLFPVFFVAAGASILLGLALQVWIPATMFRRFSRIFADRPDAAAEAFNRVLAVYGWRARLAVKLFKIPVPPGARTQS